MTVSDRIYMFTMGLCIGVLLGAAIVTFAIWVTS